MADEKQGGMTSFDVVQSYVDTAAKEYGLTKNLINSVIHNESSFRPDAKSPHGALGYMQITPTIAKKYGVKDPLDPIQNIRAGAQYLSDLLKQFDGDESKALAAYHMGPDAVARGKPQGPRTRGYIKAVAAGKANPANLREMYRVKHAAQQSKDKRYSTARALVREED